MVKVIADRRAAAIRMMLGTAIAGLGLGAVAASLGRHTLDLLGGLLLVPLVLWVGPGVVTLLLACGRLPAQVLVSAHATDIYMVVAIPFGVLGLASLPRRLLAIAWTMIGVFAVYVLIGGGYTKSVIAGIYSGVYYGLFAIMLGVGVSSRRQGYSPENLRRGVIAVALVNAAVIFWQASGHVLPMYSKFGFYANGVMSPSYLTEMFGKIVVRNTGLFINPDYAGSFLSFAAVWMIWSRRPAYLSWMLAFVISIAVFLTYARSAILEEAVGVCAWLWWRYGKQVSMFAMGILLAGLMTAWTTRTFLALHNGSATYHLRSIGVGLELFLEHPFGLGFGSTGIGGASRLLAGIGGPIRFVPGSETGWIQYADQLGVVGVAVLGLLLFRVWRQLSVTWAGCDGGMAVAALIMWCVCAMFLPAVNQVGFSAAVWILIGMVAGGTGADGRNRAMIAIDGEGGDGSHGGPDY